MSAPNIIDPRAIDPEVLYSPAAVAELLGKSIPTLAYRRYAKSGCPFTRIFGRVYYKGADLLAEFERNRVACRPRPRLNRA